jgi:hypothetical protein
MEFMEFYEDPMECIYGILGEVRKHEQNYGETRSSGARDKLDCTERSLNSPKYSAVPSVCPSVVRNKKE